MALGSKLKMMLSERGITVKDFATKIQIPPTTLYSFIKRDSSTGKLELIAKICKGLEIDISEFLKDDDGIIDLTSFDKEESINLVIRELLNKDSVTIENEETRKHKTIVIDDIIDTSHPFYLLQEKLKRGESLTDEEDIQFRKYLKEAELAFYESLQRLGTAIRTYYELLNEDGQTKADEEIERTIKQIEMLTKIPEYQRKEENED